MPLNLAPLAERTETMTPLSEGVQTMTPLVSLPATYVGLYPSAARTFPSARTFPAIGSFVPAPHLTPLSED